MSNYEDPALDPVPPGHGEPGPVSEPLRPSSEGAPAWQSAPLPPLDGVPHCPRCWYYHHGACEDRTSPSNLAQMTLDQLERHVGFFCEGDAREDWPVHQPEAYDAPIPGRVWYAGCEPGGDWDSEYGRYTGTGPRVNPETGICEGCGERACRECGREACPDHPDKEEA